MTQSKKRSTWIRPGPRSTFLCYWIVQRDFSHQRQTGWLRSFGKPPYFTYKSSEIQRNERIYRKPPLVDCSRTGTSTDPRSEVSRFVFQSFLCSPCCPLTGHMLEVPTLHLTCPMVLLNTLVVGKPSPSLNLQVLMTRY